MSTLTPMMRQYREIKNEHDDAILFFRLGDFYEMFFDDAKDASAILNITLTAREGGKGNKVPMCGIPYHAAENYIAKLLTAGKKVAICEQVEDPKASKGIVKRAVTRVITPGTVMSEHVLADRKNNYMAAVSFLDNKIGFAFLDVSAGVFKVTELTDTEELVREILSVTPSELLIAESHSIKKTEWLDEIRRFLPSLMVTELDSWQLESEFCNKTLLEHYNVNSLDGFGLADTGSAITAAGALLVYLRENMGQDAGHIRTPSLYFPNERMLLDSATRRNLELTASLRGGVSEGTLISVLDKTVTSMGARMLGEWILHPLVDLSEIEKRQDAVEVFFDNTAALQRFRDVLKDVRDIERILGRLTCGYGNARDLIALKNSLLAVPLLKEVTSDIEAGQLKEFNTGLDSMPDLTDLIEKAIQDSPPVSIRDGGLIQDGYNEELDELREISSSGKSWIASLQKKGIGEDRNKIA